MNQDKPSIKDAPLITKVECLNEDYYLELIKNENERKIEIIGDKNYSAREKEKAIKAINERIAIFQKKCDELKRYKTIVDGITTTTDVYLEKMRSAEALESAFRTLDRITGSLQGKSMDEKEKNSDEYRKRTRKINIHEKQDVREKIEQKNKHGEVEGLLEKFNKDKYKIKVDTSSKHSGYKESGKAEFEIEDLGLNFKKGLISHADSFNEQILSHYTYEERCRYDSERNEYYYETRGHRRKIEGIDNRALFDYISKCVKSKEQGNEFYYDIPLGLLSSDDLIDVANVLRTIGLARSEKRNFSGLAVIEDRSKKAINLSMELKMIMVLQESFKGVEHNIPQQYSILEEMAKEKEKSMAKAIEEVKKICKEYNYEASKEKLLREEQFPTLTTATMKRQPETTNGYIEIPNEYEIKENTENKTNYIDKIAESLKQRNIDPAYRTSLYSKYCALKMVNNNSITFSEYLENMNNGNLNEFIEYEKQKELLIKKIYEEYKKNNDYENWLNSQIFMQYCKDKINSIEGLDYIIKDADILDFMDYQIAIAKSQQQNSMSEEKDDISKGM